MLPRMKRKRNFTYSWYQCKFVTAIAENTIEVIQKTKNKSTTEYKNKSTSGYIL